MNQILATAAGTLAMAVTTIDASESRVDLAGQWKIHIGDDLGWADPEFDDSRWQRSSVPQSWEEAEIVPNQWMAWYRTEFVLPADWEGSTPGLFLGEIGGSDETYLNGKLIGKTGEVGRKATFYWLVERAYAIPPELLNPPGVENVLAVRCMGLAGNGGIKGKSLWVGDYDSAVVAKNTGEYPYRILEAVDLAFGVLFVLIASVILVICQRRLRRAAIALLLFQTAVVLANGLFSFLAYDAGLGSHFAWRVTALCIFIAPVLSVWYVSEALHLQLPRFVWILCLPLVLGALGNLFDLDAIHPVTLKEGFFLRTFTLGVGISLLATVGAQGFLIVRAISLKRTGAIPLALGTLALVIYALDMYLGVQINETFGFRFELLEDIATLIFRLCLLVGGITIYREETRRVAQLSKRVLEAHEDERRRLARDLHDGVGQSLQALRLKTQMIGSHFNESDSSDNDRLKQSIQELSANLSATIDELRSVARDLRPAILEETDLGSAIGWYSSQFTKTSKLQIELDAEDGIDPPARVKENLYRIFQEALINSVRHGAAYRVHVQLARDRHCISMIIADNGGGFEAPDQDRGDPENGIGLSTMVERARLLGGDCRVSSSKGEGTRVEVRIPFDSDAFAN